jgi:hypothetical protein
MNRSLIALVALGLFAVGCEGTDPTSPVADVTPQAARGGVVHHVSVGGADVCTTFGDPVGCDANYSLTAIEKADGTVMGQWQDTWKYGLDHAVPLHIVVDCLHVSANEAWVSGVVTGGIYDGWSVITRVADNGTSGNDAPDQIGFTRNDSYGGCTAAPDLPLYNMDGGQVKVR